MYMQTNSTGQWQTVKSASQEKRKKIEEKKKHEGVKKDRLGVTIESDAFAAFDRAYAAKAAATKQQQEQEGYKGAFAGLLDEEGGRQARYSDDSSSASSSDDEYSATANGSPARAMGHTPKASAPKPKPPNQPKKPKVSVAQVAQGLDISALQGFIAEAQQRYSTNEVAQVKAITDRLLTALKEASWELNKLVTTKGIDAATAQPLSDIPHALTNALTSFIAGISEDALMQVVVPLVNAVITEAAAAAGGGGASAGGTGKGKAGLSVMLAVVLRTRPQVLVQASSALRLAGKQLSGAGRLPLLLWVTNQAAAADPTVGVAVWVRLLLPQLLGVPELPSSSSSNKTAIGSSISGDQQHLHQPLEVSLHGPALEYLSSLLQEIGVLQAKDAAVATAAKSGGDITKGNGEVEATVPGAAVELISRVVAGKPISSATAAAVAGPATGPIAAAAAAAGAGESKKAAAVRAAAATGLAPLLPGLTALAGGTSSKRQYPEWLLLALESAGLSSGV
eukprot:GHRR01009493.1.p1 GENE.GHRR01009493.1~~GHRR01009493.1.p1  ORF type:complete len:508 (+),score=247.18 GHRR01009493.1:366-1889(+)